MKLTYRHFLHAAAFCIAVFFVGLAPAFATTISEVFRGNPTHIVVHVGIRSFDRAESVDLEKQLTGRVARFIEERAAAEGVALEVRTGFYDYRAEGVLPSKLINLQFTVRIADKPDYPKPAAYNYTISRRDADGELLSSRTRAPIITSFEGFHAEPSQLEKSIKNIVDDFVTGVLHAKSVDSNIKKRNRREP